MFKLKTSRTSLRRRNTTARRGLRLEALEQRNLLAVTAVGDAYDVDEDNVLDTGAAVAETVIPLRSTWDYYDKLSIGTDYPSEGTNPWNSSAYTYTISATEVPGTWEEGPAPLGYGIIDGFVSAEFPVGLATVIGGSSATNTTALFRRDFDLTSAQAASTTTGIISLLCDDGCAVYLNGVELDLDIGGQARLNMAGTANDSTITPDTFSSGNGNEGTLTVATVDLTGLLVVGSNVIAVEVHQSGITSSDTGFEFSLDIEDRTGIETVLDNDSATNGALVVTTTPTDDVDNGTLTLNADGTFRYTPDPNFSGVDNFTYEVQDGDAVPVTATVVITVNAINDAPVAVDDPDGSNLAGGYSVQSGETLTVADTAGDSVQLIGRGEEWSYDDTGTNLDATAWNAKDAPNLGKIGLARLGYGGDGEVTTLGFGPTQNAKFPTYYFVKSFDLSGAAIPDSLTVNALMDDGGAVYINGFLLDAPFRLDVGFDYNSFANAISNNGDNVTWVVDNTGNPLNLTADDSNTIAVEIHQANGRSSDISFDLDLSITSTIVFGVLGNDSDVEGDALTITMIDDNPVNAGGNAVTGGTVVMAADGTFTFTPDALFVGNATFSYTIDDGNGETDTANVSIAVTATDTNPPEAIDDTPLTGVNFTTPEGTALVVDNTGISGPVGFGLLANDLHPGDEGDPVTLAVVDDLINPPVHDKANPTVSAGAVVLNDDGTFTYTPVARFNGIAEFTYSIDDSFNPPVTARVEILVTPVAFTSPDAYRVAEDGVLDVTSKLSSPPVLGATPFVALGSQWSYLDDGSDQGSAWRAPAFEDSLWASGPAQLGYGDGDEATVVGFIDTDTGTVGVQKNATTYFRSAPFDAPGGATSVQLSLAADDSAAVYLNGVEIYRVNLDAGAAFDTFAQSTIGNEGVQAPVFIDLAAAGASLLSVGNILAVEIHQAGAGSSDISFDLEMFELVAAGITGGVLNNDADEPTITAATLVTGASHGEVILNNDGTFTYTPDSDYSGGDTFQYVATDDGVDSVATTVTITVTPVNDPPVSVADSYTVALGETLTVDLAGYGDNPVGTGTTVVPFGSTWNYLDDGTDPGDTWADSDFIDTAWRSGAADLGYSNGGGEVTVVRFGPDDNNANNDPENKFTTTYFRATALIDQAAVDLVAATGAIINLRRDDGAAVYINGTEVVRDNLKPLSGDGATDRANFAFRNNRATVAHFIDGATLAALLIPDAINTIAVEVHQAERTSSDINFDLEIVIPDAGSNFGILANDTDADGDALTATLGLPPVDGGLMIGGQPATAGQLKFDGLFTYTPPVGTTASSVTFSYVANDGTANSVPVSVTINITSASTGGPADVNEDGSVDLLDLARLRRSLFNSTNEADANEDSLTDRADIPAIGAAIFATPSSSPAAAAASIVTDVTGDGEHGPAGDRPSLDAIRDRVLARLGDRFDSLLDRIADRNEGDVPGQIQDRLSARFDKIVAHISARFDRLSDGDNGGSDDGGMGNHDTGNNTDASPLRRLLRARRYHRSHDGAIGDMFG